MRELRGHSHDIGEDVRHGLTSVPKWLPSKYFYDSQGSVLFDRICDLPEYYICRIEQAILERAAVEIAERTGATELVELGCGAARKTRILIEALLDRTRSPLRYVPLDISASALRESAARLSAAYPRLQVEGVVCDYMKDLACVEARGCCLAAFFGSSIGNCTDEEAQALLSELGSRLGDGGWVLLGADLVKAREVLEAAYNDRQGMTAAFNRNILSVVSRELGADFDPAAFAHLAYFDAARSRVEMHLEARRSHDVHLPSLGLTVHFALDERVRTEVCHKFTRESVEAMLTRAGFSVEHVYTDDAAFFALALARVTPRTDRRA